MTRSQLSIGDSFCSTQAMAARISVVFGCNAYVQALVSPPIAAISGAGGRQPELLCESALL